MLIFVVDRAKKFQEFCGSDGLNKFLKYAAIRCFKVSESVEIALVNFTQMMSPIHTLRLT